MRADTVASATTDWIRTMRNTRRDGGVVGKHSGVSLSSWTECAPHDADTVVSTPLSTWSSAPGGVTSACSFCHQAAPPGEEYRVEFNQVLTSPYVVTCGPCLRKMR